MNFYDLSPRRLHISVVIFLTLMTNGQNRDSRRIVDLEKRNVAGGSERNYQLTQQRVVGSCFAARKRRQPKQFDGSFDRGERVFCGGEVFPDQKIVQPQKVVFGARRKTDAVLIHPRDLTCALASRLESLFITASADT